MRRLVLLLLMAATPALAQPIIVPLQRQPQREPAPPPPSPVPVAPPQAGAVVVAPSAPLPTGEMPTGSGPVIPR